MRRTISAGGVSLSIAVAVLMLTSGLDGQTRSAGAYAAPRTAWGSPDLQGIWTTDDGRSTPLQRPADLGDRRYLTDEEFAIVKQHTVRGDEIASRIDALRALSEVIRHHHERVDGNGYPDGLQGDDIPLFSRIISVADTYDALTSVRPYRESVDQQAAIAELRRVRGKQLDPRCVDAFIASLGRAASTSQMAERAA